MTIEYQVVHAYKYSLMLPIRYDTGWSSTAIETEYVDMSAGVLWIREGYRWDGASGPTLDTPSTMRASLIHDALYQLMRDGHLSQGRKRMADEIFYSVLLEDGMGKLRAFLWYVGVRLFGHSSVKRRRQVTSLKRRHGQ